MSKPQNGSRGWKSPQRGAAAGGRVSRSEAVASLMRAGLDQESAERAFDSIVQGEREHGRHAGEPARGYPPSVGKSVTGVRSVSDAFETARPSCRNARWLFLSGNDR
ncbi:hypothetical protein SAMN05216241_10946 [Limimonas halophila]|uniref:Uncharacterized protein n=1 Tax=Limimonas halophila TaxID=1082479 RepID=A0A1G7TE48_9PROT|nr:hypothetical protein SAMN05216241_10946 [Limimonas halophila]